MSDAVFTTQRESTLWLPPGRMRQYVGARILAAVLFEAIFLYWTAMYWQNPLNRSMGVGMITVTAWITGASIRADARRSRGRQVECLPRQLRIETPDGETLVRTIDIVTGRWSTDSAQFGLTLLDRNSVPLARLDEAFLADESEAREFLRWLRARTDAEIDVTWN